MGKYYIMICECGRIHFLDNKKIVDICENGGSIVHVCGNCGNTHVVWLDDIGNNSYYWSSRNVRNEVLDTEIYKVKEIICTQGTRVPMKNGEFTNSSVGGIFIHWNSKSNNENEREDVVDTKALINWIGDDEKCEELSNLMVDIHWAGTKFEKEYNK